MTTAMTLAALWASLFLVSGVAFSVTVKRLLFPEWRGSIGVVATALIGICWALALGQGLGALGWLRTLPLVASAMACAVGAKLACRRARVADPAIARGMVEPPATPRQPALLVATVLVVLLVAAVWTARTVLAVRRGINDPDSLGYHLPFAATFAQTGYADQHRFVYPSLPVHFYPANDELLSAIALVLTRSVAFAAVKNLLYGGLSLLAAHAVGKVFDVGLLAVSAAAVVLGFPVIAFSQPGEPVNDALVVFAMLGGLAVLAHGRDRPAPYVLAMACAGVVYGSKFSAIIPGVALGLFALCLLWARVPLYRLRAISAGLVASMAVGGSWYLRNATSYGNPLPPAHVALGPLHLRQISTDAARSSFSVAWYLVRGRALSDFWDGLGLGLGPMFVVVLAGLLCGTLVGLRSFDGFRRGLCVLIVVTLIGYVTTPASAYGSRGSPDGFVINLHYAAPALMTGMVAAAIRIGRKRWTWVLAATGWLMVATSISPGRRITVWAPEMGRWGFSLLVAASLAGGVVAWISLRPGLLRWARAGTAATVAVAVMALIVIALQYPGLPDVDPATRSPWRPPFVQQWAASVPRTTIAGWVPEAALLYGPGVPNRVVTLTHLVDGAPVALDSCPAWKQALLDGHFAWAAVVPNTKWQRWLAADPAFELVAIDRGHAAVYRVAERPDVSCRGLR